MSGLKNQQNPQVELQQTNERIMESSAIEPAIEPVVGGEPAVEPANIRVQLTGEFSSKETPRMTSVMADGIAFIREIASSLIEQTTIEDKAPVILLGVRLAEWAETHLRSFAGAEKKTMVMNLLLWSVENQEDVFQNVLGDNEEEIYKLVRDVVPSVLDVVCAAAKGKVAINAIVKSTKSCLGWCFGK